MVFAYVYMKYMLFNKNELSILDCIFDKEITALTSQQCRSSVTSWRSAAQVISHFVIFAVLAEKTVSVDVTNI